MNKTAPPKWYRIYYLLVAFDVFTVSMSLYLNHRIMSIYLQSVEVNQSWSERLHKNSELGQLAADVNAPPNDVFQSLQVETESKRMQDALGVFTAQREAFEEELRGNVEAAKAAPLLKELQTTEQAMADMCKEANKEFDHLRKKQTDEAGVSMATMDRHYATVNKALERLGRKIADIQNDQFATQTAAAATLQWFQRVIAGLILVMITGAAIYGHKIRKQVELDAREKEGYIAALRQSEASLDLRVRERTAELVQANERTIQMRQQFLKKIMTAQEDERRRIAQDLHDEIGQALTSLLIGVRTVSEASSLESARERAEEVRRITVATLDEVRRLARGLRPSVLDDVGLAAALERYVMDYAHVHDLEVEVTIAEPQAERLPGDVETALYRIAQEALANTARHASARRVQIALEQEPAFVRMSIRDDGCGFDSRDFADEGGLGLSGMRERAALLNGSINIESSPGKGTIISVSIPLNEVDHGENSRIAG